MRISKVGIGLAAAAAMLAASALTGCGIIGGGAPQSDFTLTQKGVGTFNVKVDVAHGYIMKSNGYFAKDGENVAVLNFVSADQFAELLDEAASKDGYKRIEINGEQGVYYEESDSNGLTVSFYLVSVGGSDAGLMISGPEEPNVADALNIITVEPA